MAELSGFTTRLPELDAQRAALAATIRPNSGTAAGDSALLRAREALVSTIRDAFPEADISALSDTEIRTFDRACRQHGVMVLMSEGFMSLTADDSALRVAAAPYLTNAMRRFLAFSALEEREPFAGDAAMIGWRDIERRLALADQLLVDAPDFAGASQLRSTHAWELAMYLHGVDNTPVFSRDDRTVVPPARESYQRYIAEHPGLPSAAIVARYLDLLRANQWTFTPAIAAFWKTNFPNVGLMNERPPS